MALLASHDAGDQSLQMAFVKQLAFNTLIGNADAHAKNYSLLLRPQGVTLAPLYDAVPVTLYPQYNQDLAMRIAGARRPAAVTMPHWRKLARSAHLDEDAVEEVVAELSVRLSAEPPLALR